MREGGRQAKKGKVAFGNIINARTAQAAVRKSAVAASFAYRLNGFWQCVQRMYKTCNGKQKNGVAAAFFKLYCLPYSALYVFIGCDKLRRHTKA